MLFNIVILVLALTSGVLMLWRLPLASRLASGTAWSADRPAPAAAGRMATVSIIIPARNEEGRLPSLLASLTQQDLQPLELIVVDDQSTDRTATVASQAGAKVIAARAPDSGWTGKSHACWNGARQAAGEWLLFLDADTRLDRPDSLRQLLAAFSAQGGRGALSCQPDHAVGKAYESLSVVFNIVSTAGVGGFTPWGARLRSAGLFGPCILCSRQDYFAVGGHEAVRGMVLDDLALGSSFLRAGLPVRNSIGRGVISFRMYAEGFGQLWEGWSKNISQGAVAANVPVLLMAVLWVSGAFSAMALLVRALDAGSPAMIAVALAGWILYTLEFAWLARRLGRFPLPALLAFPIPFLFFAIVFAWSVFQTKVLRRVSWRGRKIEV